MRIGINAFFLRKPGTGIGQVTWHFLDTLKTLPDATEHQFFLYTDENVVAGVWPDNFHLRTLSSWWKRDDELRKYLFETRAIPEAVREDQCDVFFSLYQSATVVEEVPHVVLAHDIIPEIFPEYRKTLRKQFFWSQVRKALAQASAYVAVSQHTKVDMEKYLHTDKSKITVLEPSVDPLFEQEVLLSEKARVVLEYQLPEKFIYHGGGLEIRKNTELVLRAYKTLIHILPERERPYLVISGTLHSEKNPLATPVKKLIQELELEGKVLLLGHVPPADLPSLYALAQMFVYPSRYEGFGLPVLEAMKVGVPVITTRVASLPEVGGTAVLYTHPDDKEALARTMKKILHDHALADELRESGHKVAERFRWDTFAQGILTVIKKVC